MKKPPRTPSPRGSPTAPGSHVKVRVQGPGFRAALKLEGIGSLVVSEDGSTILGLISERDIVHGLTEHGQKLLGKNWQLAVQKSWEVLALLTGEITGT